MGQPMSDWKWRSKKVFPPDKQEWQPHINRWGEGWGTQQYFYLSLHWKPLSSPDPGWWTERWGPEGQSPSHCKGRPGSGPPEEPECTKVYGTWWDASQSTEGISWCCCQAPLHNIWQVMVVRWSPWTRGRETLYPFLKRVERRTLGTTDLLDLALCLGRSWNKPS